MSILNIARAILNSNSVAVLNTAAIENTENNSNFLGYEVLLSSYSDNSFTLFFEDGSILESINSTWRAL